MYDDPETRWTAVDKRSGATGGWIPEKKNGVWGTLNSSNRFMILGEDGAESDLVRPVIQPESPVRVCVDNPDGALAPVGGAPKETYRRTPHLQVERERRTTAKIHHGKVKVTVAGRIDHPHGAAAPPPADRVGVDAWNIHRVNHPGASTSSSGGSTSVCSSSFSECRRAPDGRYVIPPGARQVRMFGDSYRTNTGSVPSTPSLNSAGADDTWPGMSIDFLCNGVQGIIALDSGASQTYVTSFFAEKAGLIVSSLQSPQPKVKLADGHLTSVVGVTTVPVTIQLMVLLQNGQPVHLDRVFTLRDVLVINLGEGSPKSMFAALRDWWVPRTELPVSVEDLLAGKSLRLRPLAQIQALLECGATVLDTRRTPTPGDMSAQLHPDKAGVLSSLTTSVPEGSPPTPSAVPEPSVPDIRTAILAQIAEGKRDLPVAQRLVDLLAARPKLFGQVDPKDNKITVDFEIIRKPRVVSFKSKFRHGPAALDCLQDWLNRKVCTRVPWDTPAHGFVIVVPKANGSARITVNPSGINDATARVDPEGGYMPSNMIREAMNIGGCKFAAQLDLRDAFLMLTLGPTARELSVFTSPFGKLQWNVAYFGWHSFPAVFQKTIMEHVVLPTLSEFPDVRMLAWIDDIVIGAKDESTFIAAFEKVIDRILALGGRLGLKKCNFLVDVVDWCGVEVDLTRNKWRVARNRISSIMDTPVPEDRTALQHVLGILRYYYFGVADHKSQQDRLAKLSALDKPHIRLRSEWTTEHTKVLRDALRAVAESDWILVYDPTKPVYVYTDASGNHGYSIVANQYSDDGVPQPIAFYSHGWLAAQQKWTAQVKECYAQLEAVRTIKDKAFPHARVHLLCDNRNLAGFADSADTRVRRWQEDIKNSGVDQRSWIPGEWNTIADYGSRSVRPDPTATLSPQQQADMALFSLEGGEGGGADTPGDKTPDAPTTPVAVTPGKVPDKALREAADPTHPHAAAGGGAPARSTPPEKNGTPVPGHLPISPLAVQILDAQDAAPPEERESWKKDKNITKASFSGRDAVLYKRRLLIPISRATNKCEDIKTSLLGKIHDEEMHLTGIHRTLDALKRRAKVHWVGIDDDVEKYVNSCIRCQFAKPSHKPALVGELTPTIPPHVHHTWYVDVKGPMPRDTGYLLVIVEGLTRFTHLEYMNRVTAKEVVEELGNTIKSYGTRPVIIRTDRGQPFESEVYRKFCRDNYITPVTGVAYHSQGQGLVESRIRWIAESLIASLGARATQIWYRPPHIQRIQEALNSSYVESIGMSPFEAMFGIQPRTAATAMVDFKDPACGERILGIPGATFSDVANLVAAHHERINATQGLALLATTVSQAITKTRWDATRKPSTFRVNDKVLVLSVASSKLETHYTGPYIITSVEGSTVRAVHFLDQGDDAVLYGPIHVSRLRHFDDSRTTPAEITAFQTETGSGAVEKVLSHRVMPDKSVEFEIKWFDVDIPTWVVAGNLKHNGPTISYCESHGLPKPSELARVAKTPPARTAGPTRAQRRAKA